MSVINSSPFGGAFAAGAGFPDFENGGAVAPAAQAVTPRADDVAATPWNAPPGLTEAGGAAPAPFGQGGWSFGSVMNDFMSAVNNLLGQLGSALGTSGSPQPGPAPLPGVPSPAPAPAPPPGGAETYYTSATASSVGDPHDAFDGTTANGSQTDNVWNNMNAHGDLLNSDSFAGGYRVSTAVTQAAANGTTLNQSATITTNGGGTSVTLNGDGSYSVVSNGQNVSLRQGVATSLGNGESVTLNADGSLTVNDTNGQGGSITTTLARNHSNGVNVSASASDVDLGGYLTRGPNGSAPPAGAPAPGQAPAPPPWPTPLSPGASPAGAAASLGADPLDPYGLGAL